MKHGNALARMCPFTPRNFGENDRCVASGCMAWRWFNNDSGYCGLAGTPQNSAGSGITRPADPSHAEIGVVDRFIEESCVIQDGLVTQAPVIINAFFARHGACMSQKRFCQILATNCERTKRGGSVYYMGIGLK